MIVALRTYSLPFILAVALHALAALALIRGFNPEITTTKVVKPRIVMSELVVLEPKSKPKPAPAKPKPMISQPVAPPPPPPQVQPKPQPKPDPKPAPPKIDRAKQKAEQAKKERQQRLDELANQSFLDALESEASELEQLAESAEAEADAQVAQSFRMGIYQAVVGNWSRPPSARTGMQAELLVELVPTGDVVSVRVVQSSGNAAFDRSAEGAVNKAGRFQVPKESEVFERYFRQFTLLFKPEDLLR